MASQDERRMLREMAILAGRINKHKRVEKQKQQAEEKRLLRELARVSGLVNKRKRGEDPTSQSKQTQPSAKRRKLKPKLEQCVFYAKFGECKKGSTCPFKHDPKKVAVCPKFLAGKCTNPDCRLQHDASLKNNIVCHYFLQGICTNPNCPYTHVKVNAQAAICPDFQKGYCPRGLTCKLKHVKKPKTTMTKQTVPTTATTTTTTTTAQPTAPTGSEHQPDSQLTNQPDPQLSSIRPSFDDVDEEI